MCVSCVVNDNCYFFFIYYSRSRTAEPNHDLQSLEPLLLSPIVVHLVVCVSHRTCELLFLKVVIVFQ